MGNFFRKAFGRFIALLMIIHFIGAAISFKYFSYQHAREQGFISWLFSGEGTLSALKASFWEAFVVLNWVRSNSQDRAISSLVEKGWWWRPEYPALVKMVSMAEKSSLTTGYKSGPGGQSYRTIVLLLEPGGAFVLKVDLPPESMYSIDPKTGKRIPGKMGFMVAIRDHDLDAVPDDFMFEPSAQHTQEVETFEPTRFTNSPDQQAVLVQWLVGIGFSVNHFLHGVDSAKPRS